MGLRVLEWKRRDGGQGCIRTEEVGGAAFWDLGLGADLKAHRTPGVCLVINTMLYI